jgi:hypothetical protein
MAAGALALPLEIGGASLWITRQDILDVEERRAAQRVHDALAEKMRELDDLRIGQAGARLPALQRVTFLEKRTEAAAVAIVQHQR